MIGGYRVVRSLLGRASFLRHVGSRRHWNKGKRHRHTKQNKRAPDSSDSVHTLLPRTALRGSIGLCWSCPTHFCFEMPLAQVPLGAPTPTTDKRKIQRAANRRACQRNHSPDPLLRGFGSELRRQLLCNARSDFLAHLFTG